MDSTKSDKLELINLLSKVSKYIFNPTLTNVAEIESLFVHKGLNNCVHPFENKLVFYINKKIIVKKNILDFEFFKSTISMDNLEKNHFELMKKYKELDHIRNYSVNILFNGNFGTVPIKLYSDSAFNFNIFTLTDKRDNNFFDLVAFTFNNKDECISYDFRHSNKYNNNCNCQIFHSGDIGNLLHYIGIYDNNDNNDNNGNHHNYNNMDMFVVGVIGYQTRPLIKFIDQNPMISIVGENILSIVPCSLDKASLGDATLSIIMLCKIENDNLKYYILPKPRILCDQNTSVVTEEISELVKTIMKEGFPLEIFTDTANTTTIAKLVTATKIINPQNTSNMVNAVNNYDNIKIIQFVQSGVKNTFTAITTVQNSLEIPFGNGIGSTKSDINLPCLFGQISGHPSVLMGKTYEYSFIKNNDYYKIINQKHIIVHAASSNWDFFSSNSCQYLGNCLFVFHATDEEMKNINDVQMHFLTMVGPYSMVLVENNNKYFYYRGINYYNITRTEFFNEIKINTDVLNELINQPLKIDIIYSKLDNLSDPIIYSPVTNSILRKSDIDFNNMLLVNCDIEKLIDILIQLTMVCDSNQIDEINSKIIEILDSIRNNLIKNYTDKLKLYLTDSILVSDQSQLANEIKNISDQIKEIKNQFNLKYDSLLNFIGNSMMSYKGCVTRNHTLERIKRKSHIKKNVSETLSMNKNVLISEITNNTKNHGVVICNFNSDEFFNCLRNVSLDQHYIDNFISKNYNRFKLIKQNIRCSLLDADCYESVVESSENTYRPFSGSKLCCVLPLIGNTDDGTNASLPIPLFDDLVNVNDPYSINWREKCNESHIAHFRIAMRSTFLEAICTREIQISKDSKSYGGMLCVLLLEYVESFVSTLNNIPDDGSTVLYIIRGLLGFTLTFMASGLKSHIGVCDLFSQNCELNNIPSTVKIYDIYIRVLKLCKYAKWNVQKAIIKMKIISKKFVQLNINNIQTS
jgi:hypothetical protein